MNEQNPAWLEEELTLALDAWFRVKQSDAVLTKVHPAIVELSDVLQKLPFHSDSARKAEFRSPDGVRRRVNYFRQFDVGQDVPGRHLYRAVWEKYGTNRELLRARVNEIMTQIEG